MVLIPIILYWEAVTEEQSCIQGQLELYIKFQASTDYIERTYLRKQNNNNKKLGYSSVTEHLSNMLTCMTSKLLGTKKINKK